VSRKIDRAWKIAGSLVAVPVLVIGATQVASALAHEERTEVSEVDAAGLRTIDVDNAAGSIRVVGVEGADTVSISARISDGWRKSGHRVHRDGDRLVVEGSCPNFLSEWCNVRYTIEVPSDLAVVAQADNGRVTLTDLEGDVEARSDNGGVELARIEGDVIADSDNGSVTATDIRAATAEATSDNGDVLFEVVDPPQSISGESDNGDVEVVLPRSDLLYNVATETDNGSVTMSVRFDPDSDRSITATSDNGDVSVHYALD
jgi:hypothetical protein